MLIYLGLCMSYRWNVLQQDQKDPRRISYVPSWIYYIQYIVTRKLCTNINGFIQMFELSTNSHVVREYRTSIERTRIERASIERTLDVPKKW